MRGILATGAVVLVVGALASPARAQQTPGPLEFTVAENAEAGTSVGRLVEPAEGDAPSQTKYSFVDDDRRTPFRINERTSELTLGDATLDFEQRTQFDFSIRIRTQKRLDAARRAYVADLINSGIDLAELDDLLYDTSERAVRVLVSDAPEAPQLIADPVTLVVRDASVGANAKLRVRDPDAGETHTFELIAGNRERFQIDSKTGALTWRGSGDAQDGTFAVTVRVTDSAGLTDAATINVEVVQLRPPVAAVPMPPVAELPAPENPVPLTPSEPSQEQPDTPAVADSTQPTAPPQTDEQTPAPVIRPQVAQPPVETAPKIAETPAPSSESAEPGTAAPSQQAARPNAGEQTPAPEIRPQETGEPVESSPSIASTPVPPVPAETQGDDSPTTAPVPAESQPATIPQPAEQPRATSAAPEQSPKTTVVEAAAVSPPGAAATAEAPHEQATTAADPDAAGTARAASDGPLGWLLVVVLPAIAGAAVGVVFLVLRRRRKPEEPDPAQSAFRVVREARMITAATSGPHREPESADSQAAADNSVGPGVMDADQAAVHQLIATAFLKTTGLPTDAQDPTPADETPVEANPDAAAEAPIVELHSADDVIAGDADEVALSQLPENAAEPVADSEAVASIANEYAKPDSESKAAGPMSCEDDDEDSYISHSTPWKVAKSAAASVEFDETGAGRMPPLPFDGTPPANREPSTQDWSPSALQQTLQQALENQGSTANTPELPSASAASEIEEADGEADTIASEAAVASSTSPAVESSRYGEIDVPVAASNSVEWQFLDGAPNSEATGQNADAEVDARTGDRTSVRGESDAPSPAGNTADWGVEPAASFSGEDTTSREPVSEDWTSRSDESSRFGEIDISAPVSNSVRWQVDAASPESDAGKHVADGEESALTADEPSMSGEMDMRVQAGNAADWGVESAASIGDADTTSREPGSRDWTDSSVESSRYGEIEVPSPASNTADWQSDAEAVESGASYSEAESNLSEMAAEACVPSAEESSPYGEIEFPDQATNTADWQSHTGDGESEAARGEVESTPYEPDAQPEMTPSYESSPFGEIDAPTPASNTADWRSGDDVPVVGSTESETTQHAAESEAWTVPSEESSPYGEIDVLGSTSNTADWQSIAAAAGREHTYGDSEISRDAEDDFGGSTAEESSPYGEIEYPATAGNTVDWQSHSGSADFDAASQEPDMAPGMPDSEETELAAQDSSPYGEICVPPQAGNTVDWRMPSASDESESPFGGTDTTRHESMEDADDSSSAESSPYGKIEFPSPVSNTADWRSESSSAEAPLGDETGYYDTCDDLSGAYAGLRLSQTSEPTSDGDRAGSDMDHYGTPTDAYSPERAATPASGAQSEEDAEVLALRRKLSDMFGVPADRPTPRPEEPAETLSQTYDFDDVEVEEAPRQSGQPESLSRTYDFEDLNAAPPQQAQVVEPEPVASDEFDPVRSWQEYLRQRSQESSEPAAVAPAPQPVPPPPQAISSPAPVVASPPVTPAQIAAHSRTTPAAVAKVDKTAVREEISMLRSLANQHSRGLLAEKASHKRAQFAWAAWGTTLVVLCVIGVVAIQHEVTSVRSMGWLVFSAAAVALFGCIYGYRDASHSNVSDDDVSDSSPTIDDIERTVAPELMTPEMEARLREVMEAAEQMVGSGSHDS